MATITTYYQAGYPVLWVETTEPHRAERELAEELRATGVSCYRWDVFSGGPISLEEDGMGSTESDPVEALRIFVEQEEEEGRGAVLFLWNYHHFVDSPEVQQAVLSLIPALQRARKMLVVLAPVIRIPTELEKVVTVIDFTLPTKEQLTEFASVYTKAKKIELTDEQIKAIVKAGLGLTKFEFMSALALSWQRCGTIRVEDIHEQKAQLVRKNEVLEFYKPAEEDSFSMIGGLDNLKKFLLATAQNPLARGVLLLGVPGTGKSAVAKALGREIGLPVLKMDFGRCFGSLVGESEARIRAALRIIDAMAPCILFIDEIEKGLSGVTSSHQTDGGTGARVFGSFLQWMNDRTSNVYIIATCNDISKLPPEFLRAERWDAIFFVDLPTAEERKTIWGIWMNYYGVSGKLPRDENWTGAEIKTACRLAKVMGVEPAEAAKFVVPVARSMGEKIAQLREWAKDRCVPASASVPATKSGNRQETGGETFV